MTKEVKRYSGPATVRQSYMDEYHVECPKCKKMAVVSFGSPYFFNNGKLNCYHCNHSEKASDSVRYNAIIKRNCDNCSEHFEQCVPNNKAKVEKITVPCPKCGATRTFKPRNQEYRINYNGTEPTDPVFKLSLWLQCDIKGNLFWALNNRHLNEISDYVSSTLRERQASGYTTMVERLPKFIKEAKNRKLLLKAIGKLSTK